MKNQRTDLKTSTRSCNDDVDQDLVAKLVIKLETAVKELRHNVAQHVGNMQQAVASNEEKLRQLHERFGRIQDEWTKQRADWREKGRALDDAILKAGADNRKAVDEMVALRRTVELTKLPQDVVAPLKVQLGSLEQSVLELQEAVSTKEDKLRAELKKYVPDFRNRGVKHSTEDPTWTPVADAKDAEKGFKRS